MGSFLTEGALAYNKGSKSYCLSSLIFDFKQSLGVSFDQRNPGGEKIIAALSLHKSTLF